MTDHPDLDPRIATAARVQVVPIDSLREWDRNPHQGSDPDIIASLRRFGQVTPIVRAPDGWIIAGNTTLRGMLAEGFTTAAVVTLHAAEQEQVAYGLASNRIGTLGDDDDAKVLALLREIDVLEGTGYDGDALADLAALMEEVESADRRLLEPRPAPERREPERAVDALGTMTGELLDGNPPAEETRTMILTYPVGQFEWVAERATRVGADVGTDSVAGLFMALLADYTGEPAPPG